MRSGVLLIELLVVLTVTALLAAIAVPRLRFVTDAAAVRDEIARLVAAIDAGRGAAIRLDAVTAVELAGDRYRVVLVVGTDTIIAWQQPGPGASGVTMAGAGRPIAFAPDGLALGVANRTITLSRGDATRRVVLSKYGRLTD